MKRILNLNDYSVPVIKVISIIAVGLPTALWIFSYLLDRIGMRLPALERLAGVFLGIGGILLLLFLGLVVLEQIQDRVLYRQYLQKRGQQVESECPYCGNRQLHSFEQFCPVCGEKVEHEKATKGS